MLPDIMRSQIQIYFHTSPQLLSCDAKTLMLQTISYLNQNIHIRVPDIIEDSSWKSSYVDLAKISSSLSSRLWLCKEISPSYRRDIMFMGADGQTET